jgi:hypothetical protein
MTNTKKVIPFEWETICHYFQEPNHEWVIE